MNTINQSYAHIEKLIAKTLTLIESLHEQIVLEADVLQKLSTPEALRDIAVNKHNLVTQLEQLNSQLSQILNTENLPNTDEGMHGFFNQAETAGLLNQQVKSNWEQIKSLSAQCRILNEQNGMAINLLALHTQRALQILKGQSQTCSTYGRDGSSQREAFISSSLSA
ncbi:MAG: flagellar protein FlgN [Methylococcales bacterium]